jgi:hypothetical protein
MRMHVHSDTSTLTSIDDDFKCQGDQFIIAPYKVCVDFRCNDEITKAITRIDADVDTNIGP